MPHLCSATSRAGQNHGHPDPQVCGVTTPPKIQGGRGTAAACPHIPMTGCLLHPLSRSVPRNTELYDVCPLEDIRFRALHGLVKATPPAERTWEMNVTFQRIQAQRRVDNPKPDWFGVGPGTAGDIVMVLQGCVKIVL
jgi:hypothetical protein